MAVSQPTRTDLYHVDQKLSRLHVHLVHHLNPRQVHGERVVVYIHNPPPVAPERAPHLFGGLLVDSNVDDVDISPAKA